ncbi:DUF3024 domain-containing protein [Paenibacillus alkalitolerans]|uniref:DUF3024 domain-containing protein n=1 Tax=Paenibacillus alkalitolerans TaxID=2799335 RepID=UPI0018F57B60|nr:DUF3024 domain-containing protein [Paenibacillus alkalitolerans]
MALDTFTKKKIEKILDNYIDKKIPKHLKEEYKIMYKFRGNTLTLTQERPSYIPGRRVELPVAQFRFEDDYWKVYWKDSKDKWHFVDDINPDKNFEKQLMIVDKDEKHCNSKEAMTSVNTAFTHRAGIRCPFQMIGRDEI